MKTLKIILEGVAPLIMHNNQTVDPLNYFAKEMKKISGKRNKTEADLEQLARVEFMAGLYLYDDKIVIPAKVLNATFIKGAMKDKNGPAAKAGVFFDQHVPLIYDGPNTAEALYEDASHVFRCAAKVGQSSIIRTRPIFNEWSLEIPMSYEETVIDEATVLLAWQKAGAVVGMCDWRPQHGRFVVKSCG